MKNSLIQIITLIFFAINSSHAFAKTLSGSDIQEQIIGKRIDWVINGSKGTTRYKNNGTSSVSIKSPKKLKDKGTWRIKGNKLCSKWTVIRGGKEKCSSFKTTNTKSVYKGAGGILTVK